MSINSFRMLNLVLAAAVTASLAFATAAHGSVGLESAEGLASKDGTLASTQAGGHPYDASVSFTLGTHEEQFGHEVVDAALKDVDVSLPAGLVGNANVMPQCGGFQELFDDAARIANCPPSTQVGIARVEVFFGTFRTTLTSSVHNMQPSLGSPASFAFAVGDYPILLDTAVRSDGDYGVDVRVRNTNQGLPLIKSTVTFWGVPAEPSHDADRGYKADLGGYCAAVEDPTCTFPALTQPRAFLTNPTRCAAVGPSLQAGLTTTFWQHPGESDSAILALFPLGTDGCERVPFDPSIEAEATTDQAQTPSGLNFDLRVPDEGLLNPAGTAQADVKRAEVILPEGVTINPSVAEGLSACSRADYARETLSASPGSGCPNSSTIGSVDVESPLLDEHITGSLFVAQQDDPATATPGAENPFDSLLAVYMVIRNVDRGIIIKSAGKVVPDPKTGQLVTTFDDLPQLPFDDFHLHFREGGRAPLVSPSMCGVYTTRANFVPWSAPDPANAAPSDVAHASSQLQVTRGVGGGPCPTGGTPQFHPGLTAGTINNAAGRYSPFSVRFSREDGEQEFTHFSIKLPPGVTGKLAGIPFCGNAAIEVAKQRTGREELLNPSCPAASEVGRTQVGVGVGSILTYVPGRVYLAGPYNGSSLSIVSITSGTVGPFDVGTVVVRLGLKVNPETAEIFVDSVGSDPIPHIIDGIPVHARDIRVHIDRPEFTLNPTSCKPTATVSTVLGSGLDFTSAADDFPITVSSPFQAADCASLPFQPRLALSLSGATKRAGNPRFKAVLTMKPGEANISRAEVSLPVSEFLDNAHIGTVCTRPDYAMDACPAASIYGYARAFTPILDEPLEGPVYLRSNPEHELPDTVAALHSGKIDIDLAGRVDSVGEGQIRNTFELVPDAPVSKFVLELAGGKKGLLENSRDLCKHSYRAIAKFAGQNGKVHDFKPLVKPNCAKKGDRKRKHRAG